MSQSSSQPAAASNPPPAPGQAGTPPAPPPPPFRSPTHKMGSVLSKVGPLLLLLLLAAVATLFYFQNRADAQRDVDDQLAQKIDNIGNKISQVPQQISAYEALLKNPDYTGHPYLDEVRMKLLLQYFDIVTAFDSKDVTSDATRADDAKRCMELADELTRRPRVDQRTMLAYFKKAQLEEDAKDYLKAIDDYQKAGAAAVQPTVLIKPFEPLMSYHVAECYYWMYIQATDADSKKDFAQKALDALTDAETSSDIKKAYSPNIQFFRREMQAPAPWLTKLANPQPRSPVEMEPTPPQPTPAKPTQPTGGAGPTHPDAPVPPPVPGMPHGPVVPAHPPGPAAPIVPAHPPGPPAPAH